ncbi:MAG: hypothetical protein R3E53_16765 [Myxococcota bacterium]
MDPNATPESIHIGRDDLPWVDIGPGAKLRVLQVKLGENLWIIENIFPPATRSRPIDTGPVFGYTTAGAWKYKEYDYVNRAGSFLYEPAGSVHTLQCIEDDAGLVPDVRRERGPRRGRQRRASWTRIPRSASTSRPASRPVSGEPRVLIE